MVGIQEKVNTSFQIKNRSESTGRFFSLFQPWFLPEWLNIVNFAR